MSAEKTETVCGICGNKDSAVKVKIINWVVHECPGCKFIWVEGITDKEIRDFYTNGYFNSKTKIGYDNYLADESNHRKNALNILNTLSRFTDIRHKKILDIGCAFGFLLDEAKNRYQCDTCGLEVSEYACAYAKEKLGLTVINGGIDAMKATSRKFDAAFLIGTIEHLSNPFEMIDNISLLLNPGGLLVITTLDTGGLLPFYSLKPPEHIYYFDHNNISILLKKSGFSTIYRKTYFVNYTLFDLFHRLGEYLSSKALNAIAGKIQKRLPSLSVKIPTNEMIVISRRS